MARLTEQQKDARERILTMALLSGLTATDLVSIGGRLRRQQERNAIISHSQTLQLMEYEYIPNGFKAKHNGKTVIAIRSAKGAKRQTYSTRERYEVEVVGPKGGRKWSTVMGFHDYEIQSKWPKKLMVNRDCDLTCFLNSIFKGEIPT